MTVELRESLRLQARKNGKAVLCASTRTQLLRDDAVVISLFAIADEHSRAQAFLLDRPGRLLAATPDSTVDSTDALGVTRLGLDGRADVPVFHVTCDSRNRNDSYDLLEVLAEYLLPILDRDELTQLVFPTLADWQLFRELVLDTRTPRRTFPRPAVEAVARRVLFHVHRAEDAGQQAVVILTDQLRASYVTGSPDVDAMHLGAALTWNTAAAIGTAVTLADITAAEALPAGIRTTPTWDNETYLDLLGVANRSRRTVRQLTENGASAAQIAAASAQADADLAVCRTTLWEHVHHQHEWTRQALHALEIPALPVTPSVFAKPGFTGTSPSGYWAVENAEWAKYADRLIDVDVLCTAWHVAAADPAATEAERDTAHEQARQAVYRLGKRAAAWEFQGRMDRAEAIESHRIVEDAYVRLDARLSGTTLHGQIVVATRTAIPHPQGKRTVWTRTTLTIRTTQVATRLKLGHKLHCLPPLGPFAPNAHLVPNVAFVVTNIIASTVHTPTGTIPAIDVEISVDNAKAQPGIVGDTVEYLDVTKSLSRFRRGARRSPYARRNKPSGRGSKIAVPVASSGPPLPAHLI